MIGALAAGAAASKNKYVGISTLVIVIAIVAIAFIIINKLFGGINGFLEGIGLKKDEKEIQLDSDLAKFLSNSSNPSNPFSPSFYKSAPGGAKLLTVAAAKVLAKQIYDSVGWMYDSPENAFAAIKQCSAQSQVSFLADQFGKEYSKDLVSWLNQKFDTDGQKVILREIFYYVSKLPKY